VPSGPPTGAPATPIAAIDAGAIQLHALDPRYVPNGDLASAGGQVLWSAGPEAAPELWRYLPGTDAPEHIYVSPLADAVITDVVASAAGYAFVETSQSAYGDEGWRVWFLSSPGAQPVELDRGGSAGSGSAPTIAMDDAHIAWAAFDDTGNGSVTRLRVAATTDLTAVTTLLELPIGEALLWYPALNGDELWFAAIHPDPTGTAPADEFDLESMSLSNSGRAPIVFRSPAKDFNPAVDDAFLVWKTTDADSAAHNWGTLHVLDRRTRSISTIPVKDANRPTLGDRFVAFDEITGSRLLVYDPGTATLVALGGADTPAGGRIGGISLGGRLLAYFTQQGAAPPRIGWAILPD
jgi:hypothetical protein